MKVFEHGDGKPEITIIGGIHGDEPRTAEVVEDLNTILRTSEMKPLINGKIKLIIANERALSQNSRYTETDLNRVFPGNPESDYYEERLAHQIKKEIDSSDAVIALHSTHSAPPPFAITSNRDLEVNRTTILSSPVDYVLDTSEMRETTLDTHVPQTVSFEIGRQGSKEARDFGYDTCLSVLRGHGVLTDMEPEFTKKTVAKAVRELQKGSGKPVVHYENFEEIEDGTVIAEDDEVTHIAERSGFTPALMSENGYDDIFGLLAEFDGSISP